MLSKLIKYEVKSTARAFLPIYAVLLFFSILGNFSVSGMMKRIGNGSELSNILSGLVIFGYTMAIFSVIIVTFVVILQRFYKNLTGDEGYLMHTLPVSTHSLIQSKAITAFIWQFATMFMVTLSVFILLFRPGFFRHFPEFMSELSGVLADAFSEIGFGLVLNIVLLLIMMVAATVTGVLLIYASISIGHTFKKHRVIGSVGAYMGLSMVCQFIMGAGISLLSFFNIGWDFDYFPSSMAVSNMISCILAVVIGFELLMAVAWYFTTHYVLTNQLNLE